MQTPLNRNASWVSIAERGHARHTKLSTESVVKLLFPWVVCHCEIHNSLSSVRNLRGLKLSSKTQLLFRRKWLNGLLHNVQCWALEREVDLLTSTADAGIPRQLQSPHGLSVDRSVDKGQSADFPLTLGPQDRLSVR